MRHTLSEIPSLARLQTRQGLVTLSEMSFLAGLNTPLSGHVLNLTLLLVKAYARFDYRDIIACESQRDGVI